MMKAVAEVMIAEDEQQAAAAAQFGVEGVEDRPTKMERMAEVTDAMEERRILLEERKWKAEMELQERKWRAEMELKEREMELGKETGRLKWS